MTIRKKIMIGFVSMAVIGIALGVVGLASTKTLTGMSQELCALQGEYISVGDVLNAHFIWRQGITEAALNGTEFTGSLDPNTCALGKWRDSDEAKNIKDAEVLALLDKVKEPHEFIHHEAQEIIALISNGNYSEAEAHLTGEVLPKTQEVISILSDMESRYANLIEQKNLDIRSAESNINTIIIVLIIAAAIACFLLVWLITGNIVKPLIPLSVFMSKAGSTGDITLGQEDIEIITKISKVKDEIGQTIAACASFVQRIIEVGEILTKIADGDLSVEVEELSEADVMGQSLKNMITNLNQMFSEINTASSQVTAGSTQVANSSQSMAQGSTEQAASVHQLSVSVNDISERTLNSAGMAQDAAAHSVNIRVKAEEGNARMKNLVDAVTEISEAGQSISKIIKVIDDIAFQTNIMALNAAVEAARAGQHGKGFAVVAEEVRNLAAKSAEAAKDTASMIEDTIVKSNLGLSIATDTAESLREIVEEIAENVEAARRIAELSNEQTNAISQINIGIDQVSQVIQQNSATAEESAATSEELSGQAMSLQSLISRFKLKNTKNLPPKSVVSIMAVPNVHSYAMSESGKY